MNLRARAPAPNSSEREITITRVFAAPRRLVFAAWTEPKHLVHWWGPHGFSNTACEADVSVGGAIRIVMRGPDGAEYPMSGVFREVVVPERLVFVCVPEDAAGNPMFEVLTTATFAERAGMTTLTLTARVLTATLVAAPMIAGMELGWSQSLDRLAAEVERMA